MKRTVIIGIGGASCSGKTILAKHLRSILPDCSILHQDDFAPATQDVPYSKDYPDVQDWDDPPTCIHWPKFKNALIHIREHGTIPTDLESHDHLNKLSGVEVDQKVKSRWKERLGKLDVTWIVIDGFVLYWDKEVVDNLDVKLFMRVPRDTLKNRREERQTYVTQGGDVWVDPPNYFDQIVWPAYVKAHKQVFEAGDVERGEAKGVELLLPKDGDMTEAFEDSCRAILQRTEQTI